MGNHNVQTAAQKAVQNSDSCEKDTNQVSPITASAYFLESFWHAVQGKGTQIEPGSLLDMRKVLKIWGGRNGLSLLGRVTERTELLVEKRTEQKRVSSGEFPMNLHLYEYITVSKLTKSQEEINTGKAI